VLYGAIIKSAWKKQFELRRKKLGDVDSMTSLMLEALDGMEEVATVSQGAH
jgi:hypothetical protein